MNEQNTAYSPRQQALKHLNTERQPGKRFFTPRAGLIRRLLTETAARVEKTANVWDPGRHGWLVTPPEDPEQFAEFMTVYRDYFRQLIAVYDEEANGSNE